MGKLTKTILLLPLIFSAVLGIETRDYLDDYFEQVVSTFHEKLTDQGVSSLPITDIFLDINRTVASIPLLGFVNYTNGFVVNIAYVELRHEGHRGDPTLDGAHLFYQIDMANMTVFSDVAADLKPLGKAKGTAELLFLNTTFALYFDKNYTTGITEVKTLPYATMGPQTTFLPVGDVMDAAARLARLELGYRMLWDQLGVWCNSTFTPLLTSIINGTEFPLFPPPINDL